MKKLRIAASILLTAVMLLSLTACHVVWDQPAQYGIYPEDCKERRHEDLA